MSNIVNAVTCSVEELKRETVKELLDNMDTILGEMEIQVALISDAVYRGRGPVEKETINEPCVDPPIIVIIQEHRDTAELLLKEIIKIREALW